MNGLLIIFISGFSIGIIGSFHCVGMCGPLALSLPIHQLSSFHKSISILFYNLGRAVSYTFMGIIFGLLGQSFALFNFQQWLSIAAGVLILVIVLVNKFGHPQTNAISKFSQSLKIKLGTYLKSDKKLISYLYIGILNGFLPCGLVYVAIAASVATGSILNSAMLMFAFGLGTLPVMALTMVFGKFISFSFRQKLNKITPYMIMCIALLLIVRGLNLGIPYISPSHEIGHVSCCHK
ncbi:MAG: sulfite exporter TauE/SafE family protein [Bacteroidia bacterium]